VGNFILFHLRNTRFFIAPFAIGFGLCFAFMAELIAGLLLTLLWVLIMGLEYSVKGEVK